MTKIRVTSKGDLEVRYKLAGSNLSREDRDHYRQIVQPHCRWHHLSRTYIGSLDDFPFIVRACIDFRFSIDPSEEMADTLLARIETLHKEARSLDASLRASDLFPFQREGVAFLAGQNNAGLFDEMGLGKTAQALIAIPNISKGLCMPTIVCSPASIKGIWEKELKIWRPDIKNIYIVNGRENFFPPSPGEIVICNYEILPDAEDCEILEDEIHPGTILIGDEIHRAKNPKANRTKAFRRLRILLEQKSGSIWGLTGTPLLNKGNELKEVCKSIGIFYHAFGSESAFDRLFEDKTDGYGRFVPDYYAPYPTLAKKLATVAIRRERKEVLPQLPDKLYREVEADPPSGEAARICDDALGDELVLEALRVLEEGGESTFGGMGALMQARKALATCKIPKLLEVVDEYEDNEEPLVVFSAHRAPVDMLARREDWISITGNTNSAKRAIIETDFQAGKYKGIVGTIGAMSEGLTLTYAHHAVFVDLDWTPARNNQAEDRICRIGQDKGVNIIRLVADHDLDHMITDLLVRKALAFDKSIRRMVSYQAPVDVPTGDNSPLMVKARLLSEVVDMMKGIFIDTNTIENSDNPKLAIGSGEVCGDALPTST